MVELIFALVIMGIVLLSAPMLIQQSIKSSNVALQQESIAAIASHTGILLSKHWDEGDTNLSAGVAPIITLLNPVGSSPYNFAGVNFDNNVSGRSLTVADEDITASPLGQDSGDFDDIDDYNGVDINLTVFNSETTTNGTLGDYVDTSLNIATIVTYANDRPSGGFTTPVINAGNNIFNGQAIGNESHLKFVNVTLSTTSTVDELDKNISMQAFSANLGTYILGGRQYP